MKIKMLSAVPFLLLLAAGCLRANTISTLQYYIPPFGFSESEGGFGQSFLSTSSDSILDSVTLLISNQIGPQVTYQEFDNAVGSQNGRTILNGSPLFESTPAAMPVSSAAAQFFELTVSTNNLSLTPGQEYIAYLALLSGVTPANYQQLVFGLVFGPNDSQYYSSGTAYYGEASAPGSSITSFAQDAGFALQFAGTANSVPEPGPAFLLGVGLFVFFSMSLLRCLRARRIFTLLGA